MADAIQYNQMCGHAPRCQECSAHSCHGNQILEVVTEEKNLGVTVCNNMKAAKQCQLAYAKANKAFGLISRTIYFKCASVLLKLYKSLVRPYLEYCVSAWTPYYKKDKFLLEIIQHRFTKIIPGFTKLPYDERKRQFGLCALQKRRNRFDLLQLFKMSKELFLAKLNDFLLSVRQLQHVHKQS